MQQLQHSALFVLFQVFFFLIIYVGADDNSFPSQFDVMQGIVDTGRITHGDMWVMDQRKEKDRPIRVFYGSAAAPQFHLAIPEGGCASNDSGKKQKTSQTAESNNCTYATNAGFFNVQSGACLGTLVVNKQLVQLQTTEKASFAMDSRNRFLVGFFNSSSTQTLLDEGLSQFVQGSGWLIRQGDNYVNKSIDLNPSSTFVSEAAPRTAIGVDREGSVWVVQSDGQEHADFGFSLFAFADLLLRDPFKLIQAINLDGGGSSTSVYNNTVINYPTCEDTWMRCQREVTSISCLK